MSVPLQPQPLTHRAHAQSKAGLANLSCYASVWSDPLPPPTERVTCMPSFPAVAECYLSEASGNFFHLTWCSIRDSSYLSLDTAHAKAYISVSDVTHTRHGTKYFLNVVCKRPNITAVMKTIYSFIMHSDKNTLSLWALAQSKSISTSILFKSVLFFGTKIITCMYCLLGIDYVNLNFKSMRKGKSEFGILVQPTFSKDAKRLVAKKVGREWEKQFQEGFELSKRTLGLILFLAIPKLKSCHKFSGLWCLGINKGNCTYVLMSLLIPYTNVKSPDKALQGIRS